MCAILVSPCVNQCCYKRIEISSNTWPGLFLSPSQRFWQCGSNILDEHNIFIMKSNVLIILKIMLSREKQVEPFPMIF